MARKGRKTGARLLFRNNMTYILTQDDDFNVLKCTIIDKYGNVKGVGWGVDQKTAIVAAEMEVSCRGGAW